VLLIHSVYCTPSCTEIGQCRLIFLFSYFYCSCCFDVDPMNFMLTLLHKNLVSWRSRGWRYDQGAGDVTKESASTARDMFEAGGKPVVAHQANTYRCSQPSSRPKVFANLLFGFIECTTCIMRPTATDVPVACCKIRGCAMQKRGMLV